MTTSSTPSLFANAESDTSHARTHINAHLWFDDCAGYRVIFCRYEILYRVSLTDNYHLALIAVALRQSQLASQLEIATGFGHSVATQRRWETRYRLHGDVGLQAKTPTGRQPTLDHGQCAFVKEWFAQGVSNREMARRLAVSETTIRRVLRQAGLRRQLQPLAELPLDDAGQTPAVTLDAAVAVGSAVPTAEPAQAAAPSPVPAIAVAVLAEELQPEVTAADACSTTTLSSATVAPLAAIVVATGITSATK